MQATGQSIITKSELLRGHLIRQEVATVKGSDEKVRYSHDTVEVCLIVEGSGSHEVLGQEIPCEEGDAFVVPPGVIHGYSTESAIKLRRLWFSPFDWLEGDAAEFGCKRYCYGVFSDSPAVGYAMLTARTQTEINGILNAIHAEKVGAGAEWKEAVRSYLTLLLIALSRYVGGTIKNLPDARSRDWCVVLATMRAVEDELGESTLTLEVIAERLCLSKSHLSKLFNKFTGMTFSEYHRSVRFEKAKALLLEGKYTAHEIMIRCGMKDLPTFYHGFAKRYGSTPTKYKQENLRKNKRQKGGF